MKLFMQKKILIALFVTGLGVTVDAEATSNPDTLARKLDRLENIFEGVATAIVPRPEKIKPKEGIRNFFDPSAWEYLNITDAHFPAKVSANNNNPVRFTGICEDSWGGDQMRGLEITFFFEDGSSESAIWDTLDITDDDEEVNGVEMRNWRFYQYPDTFRWTWRLEPIGDNRPTITGIKIANSMNFSQYYTVFDVYFGLKDPGTPGSQLGRPFEPLSWPDILDAPKSPDGAPRSVISAEYTRPVLVSSYPNYTYDFYNDLYAELMINLGPGWNGDDPVSAAADDILAREFLPYSNFIIDTDCVEVALACDCVNAVAVVDAKVNAKKGKISLNWNSGSVDGALAYVVWRVQAESLESADFSTLTNVLVYDTHYVDTDVVAGKNYLYSIVALENDVDVARANDVALVEETGAPIIGAVTAK